jgi:CHAD domain-containing protein
MAHRRFVKPNKTFRENGRFIVPVLYDEFMMSKERVVGHPRLKTELHRMRLKGKTLRYSMEIFSHAFGDEFVACFGEVKSLLGVFGKIHDCDVNIPKLEAHLHTIRLFNRLTEEHRRISTAGIRRAIADQKQIRRALFADMETNIERWSSTDFRTKIILSTM